MSNHRTINISIVPEFIELTLFNSGFKRGTDYSISAGHIYFKCDLNHLKKEKAMSALTYNFPQYSFVWESSRMLKWN